MKNWLWLFVLLCFHAVDGGPVWVVKEQIVAINRHLHGGPIGERNPDTKIYLSSGAEFYVTETPEQVAEMLQ